MIETIPPSMDMDIVDPGVSVAAARIVRRLRQAQDWRSELGWVLELVGRSLSAHRTILFRLRETPDHGLIQAVGGFWIDDAIDGISGMPTVIPQSVVHSDALLGRIAQEGRQGKMFTGLT
ncbi:hybrid sensor histidine kinase/response regulator, partial [Rhizobiaceae sp. 2RAB30]